MSVKFSNNATTELASSIGTSNTSITVVDGSKFPILTAGDYTYVTLDTDTASPTREIVKVTAIAGNVLTVARGQDGTSPASFAAGTKVELRLTAALLNDVAGANPSGEPIGFPDKSQTTITFDSGIRTFSITPTGASFDVYCKGVKYTYTTVQLVTIPNTTGLHFIYFSASGVLSTQMSYFTWEEHAPTAYVYWNATTQQAIYFGDERHGITLDWQTHEYLHRTRGAAIANGFAASGYTTTGLGATDADAQIDIGGGTFFDEDMQVDIVSTNTPVAGTWQQDLSGPARIPVMYLSGAAWVIDSPTNFPFKVVSSVPQYNLLSGSTWSTASVTNNSYFVSWILATNNLTYPVISIISQAPTNQLSVAEAMTFEGLNLNGFPSVEFRPLYKVIYQYKDGFANSVKSSTIAVYDLRSISSAGVAAALVQDHGNLSGLTDDDHPQYVHTSEVRTPSAAVKNSFLPSQTSQSGKYLTTDGSNPSWGAIPSGSLTFTGDVTGTGSTGSSVSLTLAASGVVAGQYTKVTVDAKGRVTAGTGVTSSDVTTALGYTPYNSTNPAGYTTNTGTVTSVSGTGTVSGLTLTGSVTSSGSLTLGGTLSLTSGQVTSALGFTPYNATNPSGYITTAGARSAISASGSLSYNSTTGVISFTDAVNSVAGKTGAVTLTNADVGLGNVENKSSATIRSEITSGNVTTALGFTPENVANKAVANGYASLDAAGKVPSAQLPSYVDDVVEVANLASLPGTGETGKIYVTIDTNKTHRWSGSSYIEISASPGSTDSVAEGSTNLYFTQARARASVSASGSLSYNSSTGVFSFSDAVTSVAGRTGAVTLTKSDVGLGNVENKSSATIRGELTSGNVTTALGFTPLSTSGKAADAETVDGIDSSRIVYGGTGAASNQLATIQNVYQIGQYKSGFWDVTGASWTPNTNWFWGATFAHGSNSSSYNFSGQLAFQNGGGGDNLYARTIVNGSPSVWTRLLSSGNYNAYSPTLTGTGASGTWGISISGSAAQLGGLSNSRYHQSARDTFTSGDWNSMTSHGTYKIQHASFGADTNPPPASYAYGICEVTVSEIGGETRINQIYWPHVNDSYFYQRMANGGSWTAWNKIWRAFGGTALDSSNYNSYALPLGGGTLTGGLHVNSDSGTRVSFQGWDAWYRGWGIEGNRTSFYLRPSSNNSQTLFIGQGGDGFNWATVHVDATNFLKNGNAVLHAANYNSYAPTLTGTGASGTWAINITGNAATATSATDSTKLPLSGGTMSGAIGMAGTQTITFAGFAGVEYYNAAGTWQGYIGTENNSGNLRYNSRLGTHTWYANSVSIGSWNSSALNSSVAIQQSGNQVLHAANYTSYSPSLTGSGASGTWAINITGNTSGATLPQYYGTGYNWNGTAVQHYWTRIANVSGNDGWAMVLVTTKQDVNYVPAGAYLLSISRFNGSSFSVKLDALNSHDTNLLVRIDNSGGVWIKANVEWNSQKAWRVIASLGENVMYGSFNSETLSTPANSIELSPGQQVRGTQGAATSASVSTNTDRLGAITALGAITTTANGNQLQFQRADGTTPNWAFHGWGGGLNIFSSAVSTVYIGRDGPGTNLDVYNGALTQGGNQVLHAANYSSYALPLSGGTLTSSGQSVLFLSHNRANANFDDALFLQNTSSGQRVQIGMSTNDSDGQHHRVSLRAYKDSAGSYAGQFRIALRQTDTNLVERLTLDVSGNLTVSANVTAYSDERVKANWRQLDDGFLVKLSSVKSGIYDRTDAEITQVGVSAQSLRDVLPHAVIESHDGDLSVAYGNAALVSAVELAKELVALKQEVAELRARVH